MGFKFGPWTWNTAGTLTGQGPHILGQPNYYDDGGPRLIAELETTRHRDNSTKRWRRSEDADEIEAIARLICAAPDHAIVAALMTAGILQWEPFDPGSKKGELRFNGMRYSTRLDEFGVPEIDAHLRAIFLEQVQPVSAE